MKFSNLFIAILIACTGTAQSQLPVIRANSALTWIVEGKNERYEWHLNPAIRPDIHTVSKILRSTSVGFYTGIDSIIIQLKPGHYFDFIVLLNGHDSCFTRIESRPVKNYAAQRPPTHDTISFILTEYNNLKVKAILNDTDTLDLKFDSGTTGLLLTQEAIKNKTHISKGDLKNNRLKLGKQVWDSLEVFPVELSGQGTDGRFGWDLFDGRVLEIDYDKNYFIIHSRLTAMAKGYSKLAMEYSHTLFCIQGSLQMNGRNYPSRFLFDNGYQRTIMLDTSLMNAQHYPKDLKVIKKVIMRNGQGREIPVITVNNEKLILGGEELANIPVQLMTQFNPAGFTTHILGNEVLKRFNTILDFQHNMVYLKRNGLAESAYTDAR